VAAESSYILFTGLVIVLVILARSLFDRLSAPALVGYLGIGLALRLFENQWHLLGGRGVEIFDFLAHVGVVVLLFRVGLESDLPALLERLPEATLIWAGNVLMSGGLGLAILRGLFGWSLVASLFGAVALTATSVGVSVAVWREHDALESPTGVLMLDVAELDDLSGVVLMTLLFGVATNLREMTQWAELGPLVGSQLLWLLAKFAAFAFACLLFAWYVEQRLTGFVERMQSWEGTTLFVLGLSFVIAASAALLGFSMAIGGFFAGLVFSSDPDAVHFDASFSELHDLFAPFFFVGIGLSLTPSALTTGWAVSLGVLTVAVVGKILGTWLPALLVTDSSSATLLGVSMIPRAEITLIIMERGHALGDWAVDPDVYASFVTVCAVASTAAPLVVDKMLAGRADRVTVE
jgi:Kef-type K+ transport system membrane component KefB